jgi:putative adenylate-forming enzyme
MGFLQGLSDFTGLNRRFHRYSAERIRAYQEKAVLGLVAMARRESPFYRDLYLGRRVDSLEDFSSLPTINKSLLMDNFDRLNTAGISLAEASEYAVRKELAKDYLGYFKGEYVVGLSSGTSGNKGIYLTPRSLTKRVPALFLARGGVGLSDLPLRILFVLRVYSQGFDDINAPMISLNYRPSMTEPSEVVRAFNEIRANILMAPPSFLRQLLPLAGELKRPPRRIIAYAEVLEAEEKARLSAAFRAPVVEIYQASEGQIASPCRLGNLHVNEDLVYLELEGGLDRGDGAAAGGRSRRMLVTNLVNTAQPLLRYEMNDIVELGEPCPCGSHFRTIAKIVGRNDDVLFFHTRSGSRRAVYPDLASRWIITTDDRIREFSLEQFEDDRIRIIMDLGGMEAKSPQVQEITDRLRRRFSTELDAFDIECRLEIEIQPIRMPADNRKMKRFVSRKEV